MPRDYYKRNGLPYPRYSLAATEKRRADARERNRLRLKRWREENPEKYAEQHRRWRAGRIEQLREAARKRRKVNPEPDRTTRRRSHLRKYYGLTLEQYDALLASQGGCCAICENPKPEAEKSWHVDHDHQSGKVRGLLCGACNRGLGHFKDNPNLLLAAADYVGYARMQQVG